MPSRMIEPRQLLRAVILPGLASAEAMTDEPRLADPRAGLLLAAIAIQESNLSDVRQVGGGPARSWWQVELRTANSVVAGMRGRWPRLLQLYGLLQQPVEPVLLTQPLAACVLARLNLWVDPGRLPDIGDADGALTTYCGVWRPAWAIGRRQETGERARWARAYAEAMTAAEGLL